MLSTSTLSFRGLAMALALVAGIAVVSDASAMSRKDKRTLVGAWSVAWPATCSPTVIRLPPSAAPWPAARSAT
ncbi:MULTISPECIES: hypothetical protein [Stenotrophomonas]|uniref:hypothetical protein n=1 Tax=Stenotrophomonas TaxID=40323 RepID=UPI001CCE7C43|nr:MULTISPECIES: hypothetical protein [Stenotrophomonas]MCA0091802.1 hypothetical protein [Stenotrophomonas maltophilia]MCV4212354.1 hypothetical protein [Pseudomonas cichorii]